MLIAFLYPYEHRLSSILWPHLLLNCLHISRGCCAPVHNCAHIALDLWDSLCKCADLGCLNEDQSGLRVIHSVLQSGAAIML